MYESIKYLSIITNFGCHYQCPEYIVKNNNLQIPKTTIEGLNDLETEYLAHQCNIISISGGGDPLYEYEKNFSWYRKLFKWANCFTRGKSNIVSHIPIEMHTSYLTEETSFPFYNCYRVVYHTHTIDDLDKIYRTGQEKIRVVFVVTKDFTVEDIMNIAAYVNESSEIDELSFRQYVDDTYTEQYYLHDYLKLGHNKLWHYIEQNDYNLYYVEGEVYTKYRDIGTKNKTESEH